MVFERLQNENYKGYLITFTKERSYLGDTVVMARAQKGGQVQWSVMSRTKEEAEPLIHITIDNFEKTHDWDKSQKKAEKSDAVREAAKRMIFQDSG